MIQKSIIKVKALTLTIKNNNKQKIFLIKKYLTDFYNHKTFNISVNGFLYFQK